eukprot:gene3573-7104_t
MTQFLPQEIYGIIIPFLSGRDLLALDTAATNIKQRPQFLSVLQKSEVLELYGTLVNRVGCNWLLKRGVTPFKIRFHESIRTSDIECLFSSQFVAKHILSFSLSKYKTDFDQSLEDSDISLARIFDICENLTEFNYISDCNLITDVGITHLAQSCKKLSHIDISECRNITDNGVIALVRNCHQIIQLNISNCRRVTDVAIAIARQLHPEMHLIHEKY